MRKFLSRAAACAAVLLMLTGCTDPVQDTQMQVCVICKSQDAYWDMVRAGACEAGEELGLQILYEAPEREDQVNQQIEMIDQAVRDGVQAIVLAPNDTDALNEAITRADSAGVSVLTIDSDVSCKVRRSCISTQNTAAGAIAARQAAALMNENGKAAIITHSETAQTAVERAGSFISEIEGKGGKQADTSSDGDAAGYPNIEIISTSNGGGDAVRSREIAVRLIKEHSDLKLIYATNQQGTIGACQAIREMGVQNQVTLIGFDYFDGADAYIASGVLDGVIVQNPYNMGYFGVRYAGKLIQGERVAPSVDTGAVLVTADNFQDEEIQFLVNPDNA